MSILNILGIQETKEFEKLKECSKCKKLKDINYFRKRGEGKDKKRVYPICKECEKRINKDVANLRKYAPSKPEYCDCCGKKCEKFVLDHDHELNKFRGWICDSCNIGISRLGDNLDGVMKAVQYLSTNTH
tara:strand:+ start:878 stop:1267 length:390 start_codon:yes stop_codon:yes gene_type:complete